MSDFKFPKQKIRMLVLWQMFQLYICTYRSTLERSFPVGDITFSNNLSKFRKEGENVFSIWTPSSFLEPRCKVLKYPKTQTTL